MNIQNLSARMNLSSHQSSKTSSQPSLGRNTATKIQKDVIVLKDPSLKKKQKNRSNQRDPNHLSPGTDAKGKQRGDQGPESGSTLQDLIRMKNQLEEKTQLGAKVKMASPVALTDPSRHQSSIMMSKVSLKNSSHVRGSIVSVQQSNTSTKKTHQSMIENKQHRDKCASPPDLIQHEDQMYFNNQQYSVVQSPTRSNHLLVNPIPQIDKVMLPSSKGTSSNRMRTELSKSNQTNSVVQSSQFRGSVVSRTSKTTSKRSQNSLTNRGRATQTKLDTLSPTTLQVSQSTSSIANTLPQMQRSARPKNNQMHTQPLKTYNHRNKEGRGGTELEFPPVSPDSSKESSEVSPNRFNVQSVVVRGLNQNHNYNSAVHLGLYSSNQVSSSAIYSGGNAILTSDRSVKNRQNRNKPSQSEVMPAQNFSSVNNALSNHQPRSHENNSKRISPSYSGDDSSKYNPSTLNISKQMNSKVFKRNGSNEDKRRGHSSDRSNDSNSKQQKIPTRPMFTSQAQTAATKSGFYSQRGIDSKVGKNISEEENGGNFLRLNKDNQSSNSYYSKHTQSQNHVASPDKKVKKNEQQQRSGQSTAISSPKPSHVNNVFDDEKEEQRMVTKTTARKKNGKKRRYNPYNDPNFDPNGNQYTNTEFRAHSLSPTNTQSPYQSSNPGLTQMQIDLHSNLALEKIEESLEQQETESKENKSDQEEQKSSENNKDLVMIKKCKLKRQRFEAPAPSKNQVRGGKLFRQSQVPTDELQSFASKIKANSLSDIESFHSEEEQYTSSQPTPHKQNTHSSISQVEQINEDSNEDDESQDKNDSSSSYENSNSRQGSNVGLQRVILPSQFHQDKVLCTIQSTTEESSEQRNSDKINREQIPSSPDTPFTTQRRDTREYKKKEHLDTKVDIIGNKIKKTMKEGINNQYQNARTILYQQARYDEYVEKRNKLNLPHLHENDYNNQKFYLISNGIECVKYNYSFGNDYAHNSQKAKLQLSPDGEHLIITNHIQNQNNEQQDKQAYSDKQSNASCKISDINGLIFGGYSSRFWMLRKHINSLDQASLKNLPFHSWDCITIVVKHRDVDLVIKNEQEMNVLLKYLIYILKTVDGERNTAPQVIEALNEQSIKEYKNKFGKDSIKKSKEIEIIRANEYNIYNKVILKYKIMKMRLKISFTALLKNMTVPEVFYNAILQSLKERSFNLDKGFSIEQFEHSDRIYSHMLDGDNGTIKRLLEKQLENSDELKNNDVLKQNILKSKTITDKKEIMYVKKNGITQKVKIPLEKNESKQKEIKKILQKNQCIDIFRDLSGDQQFQDTGYQRFIQYKFQKKSREIKYQTIKMLCCIGMLRGQLFIRAMLKRIELQKEMLLIEIELGREVLLANELSQDHLPMSFTYYDSIIRYIQSNITSERRDYYNLRKQLANIYYNDTNKKKNKNKNEDEELVIKQVRINECGTQDIEGSIYCLDLQRSRYIQIDDSVKQIQKSSQDDAQACSSQKQKLSQTGYPERVVDFNKIQTNISIQYLQHDIVNAKRQKFLKAESLFQQQTSHLKLQGQRYDLTYKILKWLEAFVRKKVAHTCTHGQNQFLLGLRMKSEAKQMEKTMGRSRSNKAASLKSEQANAKTLLAAMMTEQKGGTQKDGHGHGDGGHGHNHDGGENERDSEDEELEDMEALDRSLSQDIQYHGGHHDGKDDDHGDEMGMLQKSVFNLLSQESEKLIKDLYLKYRHKLRNDYKNRCQPKINFEKKKKYVEERIEKDILYFETDQKATELQNIKDQIKKNLLLIKKRNKLSKVGQDHQQVDEDKECECQSESHKNEVGEGEKESSQEEEDYIVSESHKDSQAKTSRTKSESKRVTSATPSLVTLSVASSKKYTKQAVHTSGMRSMKEIDVGINDQIFKAQTLNTTKHLNAKNINLQMDQIVNNRDRSEQPKTVRNRYSNHLTVPQKKKKNSGSRQSSSSGSISELDIQQDHNVMNSFNKLCLDVKSNK